MRFTLLPLISIFALAFAVYPQGKHWTETPDETIWREKYGNCDHGYFLKLPTGVIGHGDRSPSPNHGILISAKNPGITTQVTLKEPRLVEVYDSSDGADLGSPRAYLEEHDFKQENASERITVLERRDSKFSGSAALYVHFRRATERATSEVEELIVYRATTGIGPSFYVVMLRTTPEFYTRDHALYNEIRNGLQFVPVPGGECSND
ncbi:MAG TPA: hypothetical protein VIH88_05600 [Candidatus Acidoferrales bacterium]